MSIEQFPQPDQDPLKLGPQVPIETLQLLEGDEALLNQVMVPHKLAMEKWRITGDVLGILELPVDTENPDDMSPADGVGFQIAVVDHGENFENTFLRDEEPGRGRPRSRFELEALNYTHPMYAGNVVHAPIRSETMTVGRGQANAAGGELMLDSEGYKSLKTISREHFSIEITPAGIKVTDNSVNGTKVYRRAPEDPILAVEQWIEDGVAPVLPAVFDTGEKVVEARKPLDSYFKDFGSTGLKGTLVDRVPLTGDEAKQMQELEAVRK